MNPIQKAAQASRRVTARHALIDALKSTLEGLPVALHSGTITISDNITDLQFQEVASIVATFSSNSTTMTWFAKGDILAAATTRYGNGMELMRRIYGNEHAEMQYKQWATAASVARKVPIQDRDITRSWNYYRYRYGKEEVEFIPDKPPIPLEYPTSNTFRILSIRGDVSEIRIRKYHGTEYTIEYTMKSGSKGYANVSITELAEWCGRQMLELDCEYS